MERKIVKQFAKKSSGLVCSMIFVLFALAELIATMIYCTVATRLYFTTCFRRNTLNEDSTFQNLDSSGVGCQSGVGASLDGYRFGV